MSFKFRFEVLLDLRRRERDEAGAAVGQANEAIAKLDQERGEIAAERASMRQGSAASLTGEVSVDSLLSAGRYDAQLAGDDMAIIQTRRQLVAELERRQVKLTEAESEVKRYEKLRASERSAYDAHQARLEQQESDDATSRKYTRQIQRTPRA